MVMVRMVLELRGIPCIEFEDVTPDRKSIMASRSFGRPVTTYVEMREAVTTYATRAAEKMRRQHLATAHVSVFLHTNKFRPHDVQYYGSHAVHLPVASADTGRLIEAARDALKAAWKPGYSYQKGRHYAAGLMRRLARAGRLWSAPDSGRSQSLMKALECINRDFGRDTIGYASAGRRKAWGLRSDQKSPRYTTCWHELLRV